MNKKEVIYICAETYADANERGNSIIAGLKANGVVDIRGFKTKDEFQIYLKNCIIDILVRKDNDDWIRGKCCNMAYDFSHDECLYLTRNKSDGPTIPLLDYIIKIEKGR